LFGVTLALNFSAKQTFQTQALGYKMNTYLGLSLGFIWVLWMGKKERKKDKKESVPQTTVRISNLYNAFNGWVVQLEVSSLKLWTICSLHRYMKM
jgi:hypothetical protein